MARKATVFKAELRISDLDRHYYQTHALTVARHPSETDTRMMVRLLAFARHANRQLQFTRGLSTDGEPELWQREPDGEIELWIDLGQPDEKHIRKACARAARVFIYTYQGRSAHIWWERIGDRLMRFPNLGVINLPEAVPGAMAPMARRSMQLQFTIQDGQIWLSDDRHTVQVDPQQWKQPA